LAASAEPLLDDLAVAEVTAARADTAGRVRDLGGRHVEGLHREVAYASARVAARLLDGAAGDRRRPARARRTFVGDDAGVTIHDAHALERDTELLSDDLCEHG